MIGMRDEPTTKPERGGGREPGGAAELHTGSAPGFASSKLTPLIRDCAAPAQKSEQIEQRKPENCKIIALDKFK